jgi:hypothetical protein
MTTLPATLVEAEARTCARAWLAEFGDMDPFEVGVPIRDRSYGRAWLRRELKTLAMSHPENMMWVIDNARAGWDDADVVLRELAIEVVDRGERLPTALGAYTMEVLRGYPAPRGPRKSTHAFQNILFAGITAKLVEQFWPDLKPTRNPLSKRVSACDIVADAVNEAGMGRQFAYKEAERLWLQLGKWLLPEGFLASC